MKNKKVNIPKLKLSTKDSWTTGDLVYIEYDPQIKTEMKPRPTIKSKLKYENLVLELVLFSTESSYSMVSMTHTVDVFGYIYQAT